MLFANFDFRINARKLLHIKRFLKRLNGASKCDGRDICCLLATVRQSRTGLDLAQDPHYFKRDSRRLVKGTLPDYGLNVSVAPRYNFFSPRPRVVFFHLFLRGSRAAFFFGRENHINSGARCERMYCEKRNA
jgi:hypothetical protein